ncbi:hypothetical protein FI667_g2026, partial [Globisporangium splendens]
MTYLTQESSIVETSPNTRIASNQQFEKQFLFDGKAASIAIEQLQLTVPGFTHVSCSTAGGQENIIRVSADSHELLSALFVALLGSHGLEVRVDDTSKKSHLLTKILLAQPSRVKDIECTGSAVVVLDESAVVNNGDGDLKTSVSGSGDVYVSNDALTLRSLTLSTTGGGDIQSAAPSMTIAETAAISVVNSGAVEVFASTLEATNVDLPMTSHGDLQITAPNLDRVDATSKLVAKETSLNKFAGSIVESGNVVLASPSSAASCEVQEISITGHGSIDVGDVTAKRSSVNVIGNGDVVLQVTDEITVATSGSGTSVGYLRDTPHAVLGDSSSVKQVTKRGKSPSEQCEKRRKEPCHIPAKEAAFTHIDVGKTNSRHKYKIKIRSFSELKASVSRFFGFYSGTLLKMHKKCQLRREFYYFPR